MKEVDLIIDENGELSFIKPEPYVRINVLTKETYEKLADVIGKSVSVEVEVEELKAPDYESYNTICPECKGAVSIGRTEREAMRLVTKYCPYCGQALIREVQLW